MTYLPSIEDGTRISKNVLPVNNPAIFNIFNADPSVCTKLEDKIAAVMHRIEGLNGKLPLDPETKKRQMARYDAVHRRRKAIMQLIGSADGVRTKEVQRAFETKVQKDLTALRHDGYITNRSKTKTGENIWRLTEKGAAMINTKSRSYKTAKEYHQEKRETSDKLISDALSKASATDARTIVRITGLSETRVRCHLNDMRSRGLADYQERKVSAETISGVAKVRFWFLTEAKK